MASRDESHSPTAKDLLVMLANAGAAFTPAKALELAGMLCHIAGGDGRGVYTIRHNPTGDQIPPPWPGLTECHGMEINVDGASVTIGDADSFGASYLVFDEAMEFAQLLDQAIARATHNAVEGA